MDASLRSALIKRVVVPLSVIGVIFVVARARQMNLADAFALRRPEGRRPWLWLVGWSCWVVASDRLGKALGVGLASGFSERGGLYLAVMAVGMVLVAPLGEELTFRGLLFSQIARSRLGPAGAVVLTAALFAAFHLQYGMGEIAFIFLDGVILAIARARTGSVLVTIPMHAIGNLYAYVERLPR